MPSAWQIAHFFYVSLQGITLNKPEVHNNIMEKFMLWNREKCLCAVETTGVGFFVGDLILIRILS